MRRLAGIFLCGLLAGCGPTAPAATASPTPTAVLKTALPTQATSTLTPEPAIQTSGTPVPNLAQTSVASGGLNAGNAASLHETLTIRAAGSQILAGALSPDGRQAATFALDRRVRVWDTSSGDLLFDLGEHVSEGFGLAYSPRGVWLASGGGYEVILWDPVKGVYASSFKTTAIVYRLVWSPDERQIAVVGNHSSRVEFFDTNTRKSVREYKSPSDYELWSVAYSPDGKRVAVGDVNGLVVVFDASSGDLVTPPLHSVGASWDVEFSPDGRLLVSCNGNGGIYSWTTADWQPYALLTGDEIHPDGCKDGVFAPGGDVYLSVGTDGYLNAWNPNNGELLFSHTFGVNIFSVSVSGDGRFVAAGLSDGTLRVLAP